MKIRILITLIISLSAIGCAPIKSYTGPALPPEQTSLVSFSSSNSSKLQLSFLRVDDTSNSLFSGNFGSTFAMLPGSHTLKFHYENKQLVCFQFCFVYYGDCAFTLNTEPGAEYTVFVKGMNSTIEAEVYLEGSSNRLKYIRCAN